jgi:hypothetical protein
VMGVTSIILSLFSSFNLYYSSLQSPFVKVHKLTLDPKATLESFNS